MLSNLVILRTALAPAIWGTTYLATSLLLPPNMPMTAAVLRALPAGIILLLLAQKLPHGTWWWKSLVLGALNIGIFFPLLFVAAYRLPGGVAATLGAIQPLLVQFLAIRLTGEKLRLRAVIAAVVGLAGVALLVLQAEGRLDLLGIIAALAGTSSMALGIVLSKRWATDIPPLASTAWQLMWGGLLILPVMILTEGLPLHLTAQNWLGYAYLSLIGGAVAYMVWFAGIRRLATVTSSFLGLLSPLVATTLGWVVLAQRFTAGQAIGGSLVIGALVLVLAHGHVTERTFTPTRGESPCVVAGPWRRGERAQ